MIDMDVCYHCMTMKRPYLHPRGTLKVYHWIDPHPNPDGKEEICGHRVEMLCEDCAVVHWAEEYETSNYRKSSMVSPRDDKGVYKYTT